MDGAVDGNNLTFIKDLAVAVQPLLIGAVIWFMKDRRKRDDEEAGEQRTKVDKLVVDMAVIKRDAENIQKAVYEFSGELKGLRIISEDMAIAKRDIKTIWRNIEEIRSGG